MFGEDGWCHSCGVPKHAQNGNMVLQSRGLTPRGAWVPYGQLDTLCVDAALHEKISAEFKVEFRAIDTPAKVELNAFQIVIPTIGNRWYDPAELEDRAVARHGTAGLECPECHVWRWYPIDEAPPIRLAISDSIAIAASPEWFGAGWQANREIIVRADLAELIASAGPRDFTFAPLPQS